MSNKQYTILLVEDEQNLHEALKLNLELENYEVTSAFDGAAALKAVNSEYFDLIILDLTLPGLNGMEICRKIRQTDRHTPIMMLTAKSEEIDKVMGLETGADDYLTKPFSIREFIARVKVIFRRNEDNASLHDAITTSSVIKFSELEIDMDKRKVTMNNTRVELSPREFELIALLASNPGKSYSRKRLLNLVWGYDFEGYEHTVNSHINRLRGKIEEDVSNPKFILTTWGVGYRFNEEL